MRLGSRRARRRGFNGSSKRKREYSIAVSISHFRRFTPYEFFCEELGCGIPTWSVGRQFVSGRSVPDEHGFTVPETRTPLLMGIWGSAFCATLSHYYKEIRPLVKGLTGFGDVDDLIESRNEDLVKVHPVQPAQVPNYALNLRDRLPPTCPESIHHTDKQHPAHGCGHVKQPPNLSATPARSRCRHPHSL